jgi:hypothetical protein
MRRVFLTVLIALSCGVVLSAQSRGDSCHVYVVDVETARKAFESFSEAGLPAAWPRDRLSFLNFAALLVKEN